MKMRALGITLLFLSLLMPGPAFGMSVSWQGSTAVMASNQPFLTDWLVAYSFRNDAAFAARYMRMAMSDGSEMRLYVPQFDYLVHRWNAPDYQASIYLNAGFGAESFQGRSSTAGVGALESDIESRTLYASGKLQGSLVGLGPNVYQSEVRLGAAPYKADFEELASWLLVSVQTNHPLIRSFSVTPMIRLAYQSALVEAGSSIQGDWMLNFMLHY